jgi:hypothetical protein
LSSFVIGTQKNAFLIKKNNSFGELIDYSNNSAEKLLSRVNKLGLVCFVKNTRFQPGNEQSSNDKIQNHSSKFQAMANKVGSKCAQRCRGN